MKLRIYGILFGLLLLSSCFYDEDGDYIVIQNSSDDTLCVWADLHQTELAYPDTVLPDKSNNKTNLYIGEQDVVLPQSTGRIEHASFWEDTLPDSFSVFIFNYEKVKEKSWNEIREKNLYLVRYDFSREQFLRNRKDDGRKNRMNVFIPYPPAPWLHDVKMWIPGH